MDRARRIHRRSGRRARGCGGVRPREPGRVGRSVRSARIHDAAFEVAPDPRAAAAAGTARRSAATDPTTPVATAPARPVDALTTGNCLQLYPSAWEDAYPVVDCGAPHIAQLLHRGTLSQAAGAPFPGTQALEAQVTDLCGAPGILNWDWVAVWNEDVQIDPRYPRTAAQWDSGARSYYCFIYTYSRHELTGSAVA